MIKFLKIVPLKMVPSSVSTISGTDQYGNRIEEKQYNVGGYAAECLPRFMVEVERNEDLGRCVFMLKPFGILYKKITERVRSHLVFMRINGINPPSPGAEKCVVNFRVSEFGAKKLDDAIERPGSIIEDKDDVMNGRRGS